MLLVRSLRYRNLEMIKHKYSFANDGYNYKDMSVETAQEIYRNIAAWDIPFAFEFGWIINFLKKFDEVEQKPADMNVIFSDAMVDAILFTAP
ncbi:hypothetical protein ABVK25_003939 [Lepraria finkii]|uniref:Uncharacterized protein n=1 Tax=Lepraria finkii TaxID=1340010 RepID=A0ABR4BDI5_9LECA